MKKLLLTGIAALLLATGAAHAYDESDNVSERCENGATYWCTVLEERKAQEAPNTAKAQVDACDKRFNAGELKPGDEIGSCYAKATNNRCDVGLDGAKMEGCLDWVSTQAFWQCVEERRRGKVKHCYIKDPRWRDYFYNEWK